MNDKQRAKLSMLQATLAVLDQHAPAFAANKALGKAHQQLTTLVAHLDPTGEQQQRAATTQRPGVVKKATKQRLAQSAGELAAALLALADELGDIRLHTDSDYTPFQLSRTPDADLLRIAQNLHERATSHAAALAEQGVTPEELSELQAAIQAFRQDQVVPRVAIIDGKAQKQELNAALREANALLRNRIDKFLVRYERPAPLFHAAYQSARLTINTAARKAKVSVPPAPAALN